MYTEPWLSSRKIFFLAAAAAAAEEKACYSARDGVVCCVQAVHQMVGRHGLLSSACDNEEKTLTRSYALSGLLHSEHGRW